ERKPQDDPIAIVVPTALAAAPLSPVLPPAHRAHAAPHWLAPCRRSRRRLTAPRAAPPRPRRPPVPSSAAPARPPYRLAQPAAGIPRHRRRPAPPRLAASGRSLRRSSVDRPPRAPVARSALAGPQATRPAHRLPMSPR